MRPRRQGWSQKKIAGGETSRSIENSRRDGCFLFASRALFGFVISPMNKPPRNPYRPLEQLLTQIAAQHKWVRRKGEKCCPSF